MVVPNNSLDAIESEIQKMSENLQKMEENIQKLYKAANVFHVDDYLKEKEYDDSIISNITGE